MPTVRFLKGELRRRSAIVDRMGRSGIQRAPGEFVEIQPVLWNLIRDDEMGTMSCTLDGSELRQPGDVCS